MKEVKINTAQEGVRQVEAMLKEFKQAGEHVPVAMGREARKLIIEAREFLAKQIGPISEVRALMNQNSEHKRFIGPEEIKSIWNLDVLPVKLPRDPEHGSIMNVLKLPCPFEQGKKVWQTHYLTLVPMKIGNDDFNLNKLFDLVEGTSAGVFLSDWFTSNPFGDLTLKDLGGFNEKLDKFGRYVLWYKDVPQVTKRLDWQDSRAELIKIFPTHRPCLTHELVTGIIEIEKATGIREYRHAWGWCEDYFPNGVDGASSPVALSVNTSANGLRVHQDGPGAVFERQGSSACWNFRRQLVLG